MIRPAITRPSATEIVISASATMPEARLASHQACWSTGGLIGRRSRRAPTAAPRSRIGERGGLGRPARPHRGRGRSTRRRRRAPAGRPRARRAEPPWRASRPRPRSRRARWRRPARSRPARRSRGRSGGGRSGRRRGARPGRSAPRSRPRRSPRRKLWVCSPLSGCSTSTSNGSAAIAVPPTRRSPPQSTTKRAWAPSRSAIRSAARPLPTPAAVEAHARRAADQSERLVDLDLAPARLGGSATPVAAAGRTRAPPCSATGSSPRESRRSRPPRSRRPASGRRGRPVRRGRSDSSADRVAKQRRGRHLGARIGVQRAELARRAKPRQACLEPLDERPGAADRLVGVGLGAARFDDQADVGSHRPEADVGAAHELEVTGAAGAGAGAGTGAGAAATGAGAAGAGPQPASAPSIVAAAALVAVGFGGRLTTRVSTILRSITVGRFTGCRFCRRDRAERRVLAGAQLKREELEQDEKAGDRGEHGRQRSRPSGQRPRAASEWARAQSSPPSLSPPPSSPPSSSP